MAVEPTLEEPNCHTMMHPHIYIHPLTNVPTKCQPSTPYGIQEIAQTRFYKSRSLRQGQRSNQGHTMTMHTYTPNQCPYQVSTTTKYPPLMSKSSINLLYLTVSEI